MNPVNLTSLKISLVNQIVMIQMGGNHLIEIPVVVLLEVALAVYFKFSSCREEQLYILYPFCLQMGLYWLGCLFFSYHDYKLIKGEETVLTPYKIEKNRRWIDTEFYKDLNLFSVVLGNQFLSVLTAIITYPLAAQRLNFEDSPEVWVIAAHLTLFLLTEEILFYATHRLLHTGICYSLIHSTHHQWLYPVSLSVFYAHPVEHLLSNILPVLAGPLLFRSHILTLWVWLSIALLNGIYTHSGYDFLPRVFQPSPAFHNYHHYNPTKNFGVLGIADRLGGTFYDATLPPPSKRVDSGRERVEEEMKRFGFAASRIHSDPPFRLSFSY